MEKCPHRGSEEKRQQPTCTTAWNFKQYEDEGKNFVTLNYGCSDIDSSSGPQNKERL
jgi:hypothetical protein